MLKSRKVIRRNHCVGRVLNCGNLDNQYKLIHEISLALCSRIEAAVAAQYVGDASNQNEDLFAEQHQTFQPCLLLEIDSVSSVRGLSRLFYVKNGRHGSISNQLTAPVIEQTIELALQTPFTSRLIPSSLKLLLHLVPWQTEICSMIPDKITFLVRVFLSRCPWFFGRCWSLIRVPWWLLILSGWSNSISLWLHWITCRVWRLNHVTTPCWLFIFVPVQYHINSHPITHLWLYPEVSSHKSLIIER